MKCRLCKKPINPDDPTVEYVEQIDLYVHIECDEMVKMVLQAILDSYQAQEYYSEMLGINREELLERIREMIK